MTTVFLNETKIILSQEAYYDHNAGTDPHYIALGEDEDGNEYLVRWEISDLDNYKDLEDEGDACDWDEYTIRKL